MARRLRRGCAKAPSVALESSSGRVPLVAGADPRHCAIRTGCVGAVHFRCDAAGWSDCDDRLPCVRACAARMSAGKMPPDLPLPFPIRFPPLQSLEPCAAARRGARSKCRRGQAAGPGTASQRHDGRGVGRPGWRSTGHPDRAQMSRSGQAPARPPACWRPRQSGGNRTNIAVSRIARERCSVAGVVPLPPASRPTLAANDPSPASSWASAGWSLADTSHSPGTKTRTVWLRSLPACLGHRSRCASFDRGGSLSPADCREFSVG
jgi:hypothetical protein